MCDLKYNWGLNPANLTHQCVRQHQAGSELLITYRIFNTEVYLVVESFIKLIDKFDVIVAAIFFSIPLE